MEASLIDRIQARRTALLESHAKLVEQASQLQVAIERTRGAIALCDEMLPNPANAPAPAPPTNGLDPALDADA